jgi:hypothetical protein
MDKINVADVITFGFTDLLNQLQSFSESLVIKSISFIDIQIFESKQFKNELSKLKKEINTLVGNVERSKRNDYLDWKQKMD